ncbi:MAG: hypothetical protein K6E14_11835 [Paludibacteraceae bacterium]|nr:hypothetical protein [Paludibacteraceae bacterium]
MDFIKINGFVLSLILMCFASIVKSDEISVYPVPTVKNLSVCENSPRLTGSIDAKITTYYGFTDSDFKLVWYKSNADGTMDESQEYSEIELSPSIQKAESGSKETTYKYYVLQRLASSTTKPYEQSAPVPVTVTIYSLPKINTYVPTPKCKGEIQKLSEMFEIDIEGCDYTYYYSDLSQGMIMSPDAVTEGGLYEVQGWYIINKGTADEEKCVSMPEVLNVVFHELDAEIMGSDRTCPGVSVDLDAYVTVGGGLNGSDVRYSWTNDANSETGDQKTYNTGTEGLNVAGEVMKVMLEVSSDACNGSRAVKTTHMINVGAAPLIGKIAFSEDKNTETKESVISASDISFLSCGGKVEVKLTGVANKDNTMGYELSGASSETGAFSSETDGEATLSLGEGKYTLSYINGCPVKFDFSIIDYSNKANSSCGVMSICENEVWGAEIIDIKGPKPKIEWQKDGLTIVGATDTKLLLDPVKPEDSGVYSYTLYSAGCRYDDKIAMGANLTVKPYVKFDENSYEKRYEVVNGNSQEISLEFKVPATTSDIESDVRWSSDINTGFSHSGTSLTIDPVDTDYSLHIVAENKDYCKAETDIMILVDAKLQITAELEKTEIREGESTKIIIDTTGTGKLLHPEKFMLKVIETTVDGDNEILLKNIRNGKLEAEVSPSHDAKYTVLCTYDVNGQEEVRVLQLKVHDNDDVKNIVADQNELVDVYSINGVLLKSKVEYKYAFDDLDSGIYVVNGVKVVYVK